jgi:tetratricopeptide (TPR) repeat protein
MIESERAIALDANYAGGYFMQAEVLNYMGRSEDALQSVEKALRLNPRASYYQIEASWAYLMMGRYEEAIVASKTLILNYPNPYGYVLLAWGTCISGPLNSARNPRPWSTHLRRRSVR